LAVCSLELEAWRLAVAGKKAVGVTDFKTDPDPDFDEVVPAPG